MFVEAVHVVKTSSQRRVARFHGDPRGSWIRKNSARHPILSPCEFNYGRVLALGNGVALSGLYVVDVELVAVSNVEAAVADHGMGPDAALASFGKGELAD